MRRRVALLLALCAACAPGVYSPEASHRDYGEALDAWTRRDDRYAQLGLQLAVTATWQTAGFARALAATYPTVASPPPGGPAFFITVHMHEWSWNHLERSDCPFQVFLDVDGVRSKPRHIERLREGIGLERVYADVGGLRMAYQLSFPEGAVGPGARVVKLVVTGAPGEVELVWLLRG